MALDRRNFLIGLFGFAFLSLSAYSTGRSQHKSKKSKEMETCDFELRPHHVLDIITGYGNGIEYLPHGYGHSQHVVAPKLLENLDLKIKLVLGADEICKGCTHLLPNGKCKDVLSQLNPSPSKQAYNDVLDCRVLDYLSLEINSVMTTREYLKIVNEKVPGIEVICTHPKENQENRLTGLINGLIKLGVR